MKKNNEKLLCIIVLFIFVISMIPFIKISFYSNPSLDDYSYGIYTINSLKNGNLIDLINAGFKTVKYFYTTWQGSFSAIFIMLLQPTVWGHNYYFIGALILYTSLIFSTIYLIYTILKRFNLSKYRILSISILFLFMTIQTVPSLAEGFYWWNGASYYTLFYSFFLTNIALIINNHFNKSILKQIIISLLTIIISGSNYIIALEQTIFLFIYNLYLIKQKDKSKIYIFIISILGLLISILAPGNKVRQSSEHGMSPILAIINSFKEAIRYILRYLSYDKLFFIFIIFLLLIPIYKKINFKFKYPLLFFLITYLIFSSLFTPALYGMSHRGSYRLENIYYYSYYWFMISNVCYIFGWIKNKFKEYKIINKNNLIKFINNYKKVFSSILIIFFIFTIFAKYDDSSFYITNNSLKNKEAQTYDIEYKERIKLLEDENIKDVVFNPFSVKPKALFIMDISSNTNDWRNEPIRKIYNKNSVKLKK